MHKALGKITGIDLINQKLFIEVDKSQVQIFNDTSYLPLFCSENSPRSVFVKLTKQENRWLFQIMLKSVGCDNAKYTLAFDLNNVRLTDLIGRNISIELKSETTEKILSIVKINQLSEFIIQ